MKNRCLRRIHSTGSLVLAALLAVVSLQKTVCADGVWKNRVSRQPAHLFSAEALGVPARGFTPVIVPGQRPLLIIVAHGTFARKNTWTRKGSTLHTILSERFPEATLFPFVWTGHNNHVDRNLPIAELISHIQENGLKGQWPDIFIVSHSHGGNAAIGLIRTLMNQTQAWIQGAVMISPPYIDSKLAGSGAINRGVGRNWYFIVAIILSALALPEYMTVWRSVIAIGLTLLLEAIETAGSVRWYRAAQKVNEWDVHHKTIQQTVPILTLTWHFDEAYYLLHGLSRIQRYVRFLREHTMTARQLLRTRLSWPLKAMAVLLNPFRPIVTLMSFLMAGATHIAFGQNWGVGMKLDLKVTRDAPSDFSDRTLKFIRPVNSFLYHCGVYNNEDAIREIGDFIIEQRQKERPVPVSKDRLPIRTRDVASLPTRLPPPDHPLAHLFSVEWKTFIARDPNPVNPTETVDPIQGSTRIEISKERQYVKMLSEGLGLFMQLQNGHLTWIAREAPAVGALITTLSEDIERMQVWRRTTVEPERSKWFIVLDDKTLYANGQNADLPVSFWNKYEFGTVTLISESGWRTYKQITGAADYQQRFDYSRTTSSSDDPRHSLLHSQL